MSNAPRLSDLDGEAVGVGKAPPKRKRWPSWARIILVVIAIVCFLVGLAQYHQYQSRLVPHLPSGSRQVLSQPEIVAGVTRTAGTNMDITVVHKKGRIPTDLVPVRWSTETLQPASRDLRITWDYGNCGAPNRETDIYLLETSNAVLIDVWDDTRMDLPFGTACAGVSLTGTATVHLAEPLGSRALELHEIAPH